MREPTRRLFFALWPDETLRATFAHATHKAVRASGGRLVPARNLHVTLLFLGSVAERCIPELKAIGARVAAAGTSHAGAGPAPQLVFDRLEHWGKPRILVATVGAQSTQNAPAASSSPSTAGARSGLAAAEVLAEGLLAQTHADLAPDLERSGAVGITLTRQFRPHVTLAREVHHPPRFMKMEPVSWNCTDFVLVESKTLAEGSVYTVLERFPWVE